MEELLESARMMIAVKRYDCHTGEITFRTLDEQIECIEKVISNSPRINPGLVKIHLDLISERTVSGLR